MGALVDQQSLQTVLATLFGVIALQLPGGATDSIRWAIPTCSPIAV
jgi:hypothetical protein